MDQVLEALFVTSVKFSLQTWCFRLKHQAWSPTSGASEEADTPGSVDSESQSDAKNTTFKDSDWNIKSGLQAAGGEDLLLPSWALKTVSPALLLHLIPCGSQKNCSKILLLWRSMLQPKLCFVLNVASLLSQTSVASLFRVCGFFQEVLQQVWRVHRSIEVFVLPRVQWFDTKWLRLNCQSQPNSKFPQQVASFVYLRKERMLHSIFPELMENIWNLKLFQDLLLTTHRVHLFLKYYTQYMLE